MTRTWIKICGVRGNMTTAQASISFPRNPAGGGRYNRAGATRAGKWTFTPGFAASTVGKGATLRNGAECVDLHYSSSALEDFLITMSRIQAEFHAAEPSTARRGENSERASDV
ncbi:hypothetical protein GCM10010393_33700 [Streptomyces gobitricini]|uniref:DUF397 domain-containing protein n=1 Tax=Streptomyces gobitricini TaxID=68211 RepID=A0ABN3MAX6_9ACTN